MLSTQYQFSFYKKAHAQASCSYSVIGTLQRPLGRGSLGVQVSQALYLTIFIGQYTRFIHNAPPQSVCCSYSLQHRNASLQDRSKQAAGCVCEKVCSRVCLYEQHKKKQFNKKRGVCTSLQLYITHVHRCQFSHLQLVTASHTQFSYSPICARQVLCLIVDTNIPFTLFQCPRSTRAHSVCCNVQLVQQLLQ